MPWLQEPPKLPWDAIRNSQMEKGNEQWKWHHGLILLQ
jgi:hypothetical protein